MKMINRKEKYEELKKAAKTYEVCFFEDLCNIVSISTSTFYRFYPVTSSHYKEILQILDANRARAKESLRKKWFESDSATLQVALYKILGNDNDRKKLCSSYIEVNDTSSNAQQINSKSIAEIIKALKDVEQ